MIAEIIKGSSCKNFVEYNEHKVNEGVAKRISSTLHGTNAQEIKDEMNFFADQNTKVKKNKFLHIAMSFHIDDQINTEQFLDIWQRYKEEMGYENTANVIYEHNDTRLKHYHIVLPTIDFDGNKINDFNDFVNSRDTNRKLEQEFGLHQIEYDQLNKKSIDAINAEKYSIYNMIKNGIDPKKEGLSIGKTLMNTIIKYRLSNQQVQENFISPGQTTYKELFDLSQQFITSYKDQLVQDLLEIRRSSENFKDFQLKVKSKGLYIRRLKRGDGNYNMVYGNPKTGTYIKNNKLPKVLRYEYLFNNNNEFSIEDQAKFLRNIAIKSLKSARDWNHYIELLSSYNIEPKLQINKSGVYAYSLKSNNIKNGEFIKSSAIHHSITIGKLPKHIKPEVLKTQEQQKISSAGQGKEIKKALSKGEQTSRLMHDDSDAIKDEIRKRKLRDQEERDRGEGPSQE